MLKYQLSVVVTHHHGLWQSVVHADRAERLCEQAAMRSSSQGELIQVRGGASPESPGDERAPPFKWLLREV